MLTRNRTPIAVLSGGIAAGLIGTACMTALQEVMAARRRAALARSGAGTNGDALADPWAKAPAPAQLARRMLKGVAGVDVPPRYIPLFTNAVHWGYGTGLGSVYAAAQELSRGRPAVRGPLFGMGVWAWSYATLVPAGLYQWPWHYRADAIAKDVSYHLVYGSGVAAGYELVSRRGSTA
jgi:hypothetical protein